MLMQKSKYAKVKIIPAMLKVNMDDDRCYLSVRVRIFKSIGHDFFSYLDIPRVHLSISEMETLMVAPLVLVTDDVVTFSLHTCLVCGLRRSRFIFHRCW
jgi:hypothetical protein